VSLQTVILLDLPNYLHLFYPRSKQGFRTNCYSMGGVNQMWILKTKQRLKMCFSRYNQCPSPHAITLKHQQNHQTYIVKGHHLYSREWNTKIGRASFRASWESPVWSLPHTNTSQRLKMCFSRYNQCPSPHAITLKHLISLPSTQLFVMLGEYSY
jgi:hypothetical protein